MQRLELLSSRTCIVLFAASHLCGLLTISASLDMIVQGWKAAMLQSGLSSWHLCAQRILIHTLKLPTGGDYMLIFAVFPVRHERLDGPCVLVR